MDIQRERDHPGTNVLVSLVNGLPQTTISLNDRAVTYGDGLFETIALIDGVPHHWTRHLRRLATGCARLYIDYPPSEIWTHDLANAISFSSLPSRAVLKLLLSRGEGRRGYAPDSDHVPQRIVQLSRWPIAVTGNLASFVAGECSMRVGSNPTLAGIKHLNRLEQVLGAREIAIANVNEGVMFDLAERAIAGVRSNLFIVRDGRIRTPALAGAGVAGIMREVVLEEALHCGLNIEEGAIERAELAAADELFFTNSLWGIQPATAYVACGRVRTLITTIGVRLRDHFQQRGLMP